MTGPFAIVKVTLRQLLGGRRLLVLGLLGLIPGIIVWLTTSNRTAEGVFDVYHDGGVIATLFLVVMPITSIVLGSAALGDEKRDGTLSFLVVRPLPRSTITAAKLIAAWIASAAVSAMSGAFASIAVSIRASDWSTFVPTIVGLAIGAGCYTAVFIVLGHLTSRAVLMGLIYLFVWETGISFAAPALSNVSLFRIGLSAYAGLLPESHSVLSEPLGAIAPGLGGAVAKLAVLGVLAVLATAALLRNRDIA
jgi:ABC-type transport system involved in multi-copper enzyme maturation permease subunit